VRHRPESIGCRFPEDHPIQLTMVHDLYVAARMVRGEDPIGFHAEESRNAAGRVDMSWATLRWKDGRIATFQCHMMLPEGAPAEGWDRVEIFGDGWHSEATTNPAPWTWTAAKQQWPINLEVHDSGGMLMAALRNFLQASLGHPIPEGCRVADALQVQDWIERLLHSAANP
jgi:predicted dehydrogenase